MCMEMDEWRRWYYRNCDNIEYIVYKKFIMKTLLNVDVFQYGIEIYIQRTYNIPMPHVKDTFEVANWIEQNYHDDSYCHNLVRKDIFKSDHKNFDRENRNMNDFGDALEIACEDDANILETIATHHNCTHISWGSSRQRRWKSIYKSEFDWFIPLEIWVEWKLTGWA